MPNFSKYFISVKFYTFISMILYQLIILIDEFVDIKSFLLSLTVLFSIGLLDYSAFWRKKLFLI
jgi:hypothetical protein